MGQQSLTGSMFYPLKDSPMALHPSTPRMKHFALSDHLSSFLVRCLGDFDDPLYQYGFGPFVQFLICHLLRLQGMKHFALSDLLSSFMARSLGDFWRSTTGLDHLFSFWYVSLFDSKEWSISPSLTFYFLFWSDALGQSIFSPR